MGAGLVTQYPDSDQYNWQNKKHKPLQPFPNSVTFLALIFANRAFVVRHFRKKFPMHLYLCSKSECSLSDMMKQNITGIIMERLENEEWETGKPISRTGGKKEISNHLTEMFCE